LACAALPVTVIERSDYAQQMTTAKKRIGKRDLDDVDVLALALKLSLPVWSNDNDFEGCGVEWQTTAELLKTLGIVSS
jgi:predicted nucleic acid-binding protein